MELELAGIGFLNDLVSVVRRPLRGLRVRAMRYACATWCCISRSKVRLFILVMFAAGAVILVAKFVFGLHGLLRLADVGYNVPGGPGALGAGGAGAAGGGTTKREPSPTSAPSPPKPWDPYRYGPPPTNYPPYAPGSRGQRTETYDRQHPADRQTWYRYDSTGGKWTPVPPLQSTQGDKPIDPQAYGSSGAGTKA